MSVNYSTKLGYGFLVTGNECCKITEENYDSFVDSEFFIAVDSYANNPIYFFGLIIMSVEPGDAAAVPVRRNLSHSQLIDMLQEFKTYFPGRDNYMPRDYLLSCID